MENQKSIAVLNTLIILNNDRIEGYETAIKETNEEALKSYSRSLFKQVKNANKN